MTQVAVYQVVYEFYVDLTNYNGEKKDCFKREVESGGNYDGLYGMLPAENKSETFFESHTQVD